MKQQHVQKRRWYRYFIHILVLLLIITSIRMNGLAEKAPPFTPSPNSEQNPEVEMKEKKNYWLHIQIN